MPKPSTTHGPRPTRTPNSTPGCCVTNARPPPPADVASNLSWETPAALARALRSFQFRRLRAIHHSLGYDFLLSTPADYFTRVGHRWPLILFLHGAGERGTRVEDVARHGLARLLSDHAIRSDAEISIGRDVAARFIVVAPQCPPLDVWNDDGLLALLDFIERDYDVDARRVYVTGMSMGGFGTWSLGLRHPERFAAIAPVCGGGRLADVAAASSRQPAALQRLGVWTFHGAKDRVVPAEESQRMFDALEAAGVRDTRLTVYPEIGHDAWNAAYGNPELYAWLLTQTL